MIDILTLLSAFFVIISALPYIIAVVRRSAKPRIVSWAIWGALNGIAMVASIKEGQYATAILLGCFLLMNLSIVVLGWRFGSRKIEIIDFICLIGAVIGIVIWQTLDSPSMAVVVTISVDFVGLIPTLVHSWKKPREEAWLAFFISSLGAVCTVFTITDWRITSYLYPIYIIFANMAAVMIIILRRINKKQPLFLKSEVINVHKLKL